MIDPEKIDCQRCFAKAGDGCWNKERLAAAKARASPCDEEDGRRTWDVVRGNPLIVLAR